ncbi:hypothetical protein HIM_04669 [Hirsutella minnesotensis 3608]|uniref:Carrier domain-containing protein n=1 Tax=Hirsutella minnesotensis 3608 TaxID=1043627 RepID=A0A0F7ZPP2_9HYPO|nr:hypothetical protein HIM_04669 [Hirsutella minnesotensis 3608]
MKHQVDQLSNGHQAGGEETTAIGNTTHEAALPRDLDDIWTSNSAIPEAVEACVHSLFKRSVRERPSAQAVCSWDGNLTYGELDRLSTKLAHQLADLGVGPGSLVVHFFEKSVMVPVALLGVMKAGGASVVLDSTQPEEQLRVMAAHVVAPVILSSPANQHLARQLCAGEVVILERHHLSGLNSAVNWKIRRGLQPASPSDALCVVFTSGCTGALKGVTLTHRNYSSSIIYQQEALGFTSSSRTFDWAPYGSHVAWSNLIHTITCGGCLCIPSDADGWIDIEASMAALRANYLQLTPTTARSLDFSTIPDSLQVNLVGEPAGPFETYKFGEEVAVANVYGLPEVASLLILSAANGPEPQMLGSDGGVCPWVVDLGKPQFLAPFGAVGELWLEGPLIGQGYLDDDHDSAAAFVEDPEWLLRGSDKCPGRHGRLFRTGDLVRYQQDGQLAFIGRKGQAKAQGQLDELKCLPIEQNTWRLETDDRPMPQSETERRLQALWAQVLLVDPDCISRDDDFFSIGGNGTEALRLSRLASERGLLFTVRDVFQNPRLRDLCAFADSPPLASPPAIPPFSLLERPLDETQVRVHMAHLCGVKAAHILDVLPCTPLQAGMLALTERQSGAYVARNVFEIGDGIDLGRLKAAWDQVVALHPILRTRLASLPNHGMVQVVLEEGAHWVLAASANDVGFMGPGAPLTRFTITDAATGGRSYFLWDIHHALYDGWSVSLLLHEAQRIYYNEAGPELVSMAGFIKYVQHQDEKTARTFWRAQFTGLQQTSFPAANMKKAALRPAQPALHMNLNVHGLGWGRGDNTPATIVRAAWAMVVALCDKTSEALYGVTVSGRQAAVPGIEHVAGPTISTVPVRVRLDWDASVSQLLDAIQRQATDMIPFEQTGLQRIRRMGAEAALGCDFGSLLVVQPADLGGADADGGRPFLSRVASDKESGYLTYAIEVECGLRPDEACLSIDYDPGAVGTREMEAIAHRFELIIRQLADRGRGNDSLAAIARSSQPRPSCPDQVLSWNAEVPSTVDECVHNLIVRRAQETPWAPAICAWDGELSYQQLDDESTKLARKLAARGVAGTYVPLVFEKSLGMPVAVLAVLKAGGALVAMEAKEPEERLCSILARTTSPVLLSSVKNSTLARRIVPDGTDVMVCAAQQGEGDDGTPSVLPAVDPSSVLYVVFTSGSTGTPKGVRISHRNFCSAISHQQQALGYTRTSRVLDFASCVFDVSWSNLFYTLTAGACLCIPSPSERENDLAGYLSRNHITLADLTPSVARALGPESLSKLATMILGGEAPLPSDAALAGERTRIINAYGPAECTPTATLATLDRNVSIGRGLGLCTWIVEPDDADSLAAFGDVGELWLEGPLVGDGYLNDPQRTAAAFIDDPVWLMQAVGRRGRVYRTGDLVRYAEDGSIVFVGRKDTQVKIRGQRVELGEVESSIRKALREQVTADPDKAQVVAEAVQLAGSQNSLLVAFITLPDAETMTDGGHRDAVRHITDGLKASLSRALPSYMIPAAYLPVRQIPITTAGKTDRCRLREMGVSMWREFHGIDGNKVNGKLSEPLDETESILQKAWMSVLNLTAEEASVDAGFTSLGGDSITAMQLVSQCRLHNIIFTASDIMESGTIRRLAARTCLSRSAVTTSNLLDEAKRLEMEDEYAEFDLSPMQHSFFRDYPQGLNHFTQSFLLDLGQGVSAKSLRHALQAVVTRHAMLRARFHKDSESGAWRQRIAQDIPTSFALAEYSVCHQHEVITIGQRRQESLDICQGPVFACDLFQMPQGRQVILLTAHHLVIDLVSWRIIWDDAEQLIRFGELRSHQPLSFRSWCAVQAKVGANLSPVAVLPYSIPEPELDFWGVSPEGNVFGKCDSESVSLSFEATKLLFGDSNASLRTDATDLMLGALFHSFAQTFPERSVPAIWLEGHGREQFKDVPTDVSTTVGWFTTMYPVVVSVNPDQPVTHAIRVAKDTRSKVPVRGLPFYACQHYSESGRQSFLGHDIYEIVFNFVGKFQQLEKAEGLFKPFQQDSSGADPSLCEISLSARRPLIFDIFAEVSGNVLGASFRFPQDIRNRSRIQKWAQTFIQDLESVVCRLAQEAVAFTLSDMPLLQLSYRGLDTLIGEQLPKMGIKPGSIKDIYSCSPLQEGMLLSSCKGSASYLTFSIWRCTPTSENTATTVCPFRLEEAWKRVVSRHTVLSSVFTMHPDGNGFIQLVLDRPPIRVAHVAAESQTPVEKLSELQEPSFAANEPRHLFTICHAATGEVACRLDMSHELTDAHSETLIQSELVTAYDGVRALPPAPPFSNIIRYINSTPKSQTISSWTSLLDGIEPCEFPMSSANLAPQAEPDKFITIPCSGNFNLSILDFCKKLEILPSAFLQVAWAMVLSHVTGRGDVCFAYLNSGRDAPVDGVDRMVGPLANLLVSRVDLRAPVRQVVVTTSERSKKHMAIQHASLAEIQHHLGLAGRRLFNTSLSVTAVKETAEEKGQLSFHNASGGDAHEFDLRAIAAFKGKDVELSVEFRSPFVDGRLALEANRIFHEAIEFLMLAADDGLDSAQSARAGAGNADTLLEVFFKRTMGVEESEARDFWKTQLANTQGIHFPLPTAAPRQAGSHDFVAVSIEGLDWACHDLAAAETTIRAAWALMTARVMGADESVFGVAVPRREGVAPLPFRVAVHGDTSLDGFLARVQRQAEDMVPFQQMNVERIRLLDDDTALACNFQTVLAVFPNAEKEHWQIGGSYPLVVLMGLEEAAIHVHVQFDPQDMERVRVSRVVDEFEHVLRQLVDIHVDRRQLKLADITIASQRDVEDVWAWNATLPDAVDGCMHDLILRHANDRPTATAIHAWDGTLTYHAPPIAGTPPSPVQQKGALTIQTISIELKPLAHTKL